MKKQIIALILAFLIIMSPTTFAQVTGTSDTNKLTEAQIQQELSQGEDILINVGEYQPNIVPQQAFETDDYLGYVVYASLYGVQTNPFIDISKIRTISYRVVNTNVPGVSISPRPPPYRYSLDNLGSIAIRLPKIKDERKIPKRVDINVTANILYDIGKGFGVNEVGINLPQLTEQEFLQNKVKYSFWSGRGYVRADTIEDNKATFTVYDGRQQRVSSGITLFPGQESSELYLSSGYFFPGIGEEALRRNIRDRFKISLDSIDVPRDKAKLQILVNNRFISDELAEGQRLYEGSSWKIQKIYPGDVQDRVELYNQDTKESTIITGYRTYVTDCSQYKTKDLCSQFAECEYDEKESKCVSKVQEKPITTSEIFDCTMEYEENLPSTDPKSKNFYYRYNNGNWELLERDGALFKDWQPITPVVCEDENFINYAPAYKEICSIFSTQSKNLDSGLGYLISVADKYVGNYLIMHVPNAQPGYERLQYGPGSIKSVEELKSQCTSKKATKETINEVAEKEITKIINNFNKLGPSSAYEDNKAVIDDFTNIIKKYPNTVYATLAQKFIYNEFSKRMQDYNIDLKKQIQTYIGEKFIELGITTQILKDDTAQLKTSQDYYRKAIEAYQNVVQFKGQITEAKFYDDKAPEAQRRIAEIYDYYLNEVDNAIQAYTALINNYEITELEKVTYQSRIDFLKTTSNYKSQPVDLYEDGNLVRVILNGLEKNQEKPTAYISLDGIDSKGYKEGDLLTTNWKIEKIDSNKINLISNAINPATRQYSREQLLIDKILPLDGHNIKLTRIDTKKEAHITIKPVLKALSSTSNFQLRIPIERRAIRLSSEQIDHQVELTKNWLNFLNSAIDKVEKLYKYLTYYCTVVFSVLFVKNLVQGFGGQHLARQQVLEQWKEFCDKSGVKEDCYDYILKNYAKEADEDTGNMKSSIQNADKTFDAIKEAAKRDKCDSLIVVSIGSKISDDLLKDYCKEAKAKLDSEGEVKNEDQIRSALLQKEKATMKWALGDKFSSVVDNSNKNEFIKQDANLRISTQVEQGNQEIRREIFNPDGTPKEWNEIDEKIRNQLTANGIDKNEWNEAKKNNNVAHLVDKVNNYFEKKKLEIYQKKAREILSQNEYYQKVLNADVSGLLENQKNLLSTPEELKDPGKIVEGLDTSTEPIKRADIFRTDSGDWYSNNNPIYVVITKKEDGKLAILDVKTLKNYLKDNGNINAIFEGGNFKKLQENLPKDTYLSFQQNIDGKTKYRPIDVKDLPITPSQVDYRITVEDGKLKTITVNANYFLEVNRNSQGVITTLTLWKKGYNGEPTGLAKDSFSVSRCRDELKTYATPEEASEACSNLISADKKDLTKAGTNYLKYKVEGAVLKSGALECLNVMGAEDCKWLFSACDPVFCPTSRFTYDGHRVDNVVSSGIFGSIYLGWGLWRADIPPEAGICVPGILAGLKNMRSIVQGYQQCLLVKKEKGENVGICDTIFNIGICKVAWREAYSFLDLKGGLIGALIRKISHGGVYGGQEYAFFYENLKQTGNFVNFFTNEYAKTFFDAFKGGSTQEIGDTICEYAIYGKLPGGGSLLEQLTRPEGPPQFIAIMDEAPHANIGPQPTSDYSVFYHIYAGESYPQIKYYVYLHDIDERISPSVLAIAPRFGLSGVSTGYLNRGDFVSDTVRLSDLPTGYDEVCVVINNVKKCGFGKVSSDFGIQYLQEKLTQNQLEKTNITSARECIPDSSLVSQFVGAGPLQIGAALGGNVLGSGLSQTGVIRKCSIENPGKGVEESRWQSVGTCGKDDQKRDLGTCWLDKNSLNLLNEDAKKEITRKLEDNDKLRKKLNEFENSKDDIIDRMRILGNQLTNLDNKTIQEKVASLEREAKRLVDNYDYEIFRKTINPDILQPAYFSVGEIYDDLAYLLRAREVKEQKKLEEKKEGEKVEVHGVGEFICEIEYEEDNGVFSLTNHQRNFFYRFSNIWQLKELNGYTPSNSPINLVKKIIPFNNWINIDQNTCKNDAFNYYDPVYKELCEGLIGKSQNDGVNIISSIIKKNDDDNLIIHSRNEEIILEHDKVTPDAIINACVENKVKEKSVEPTLQPYIVEITLVRPTIFKGDYRYVWDGVLWRHLNGPGLKAAYDEGIKYIKDLLLNKDEDVQQLILECKQNPFRIVYNKESLPKDLEFFLKYNIQVHCNYPPAYPQKAINKDYLDKLKTYDIYIDNAINESYSLYKIKVPKNLVKAVILRESSLNENALSYCGAVGLMQVLPDTARSYGLNVPNYGTSVEPKCNNKEVSNCRAGRDLNCNKENDDRFNPEKDIRAGTLYLTQGYQTTGNFVNTAAYYNGGPNAVSDSTTCKNQKVWECLINEGYKETREYVDFVLGYKSYLDNLEAPV